MLTTWGNSSGLPGPSLDLNFTTGTLDPRITFTRASTAMYSGSDGLIKTAAINTPRFDHNPITGESKGFLIEEQRTNLLTYSEQFDNAVWAQVQSGAGSIPVVTTNTSVAPDGTLTADTVVFVAPASGDQSTLNQTPATSAGTYTGSFYVKATGASDVGKIIGFRHVARGAYTLVTLTSSWQRVTASEIRVVDYFELTLRPAVGTSSGTVSVQIWGAQLEAGSFATSCIPTVASQVTRSADAASMTGANFSSWYRADEGTVYAEAITASGYNGAGSSQTPFAIYTDLNNGIRFSRETPDAFTLRVNTLGVSQALIGLANPANGTSFKVVGAYKSNDFAATLNSGSVGTDSSGPIPSVSTLSLGGFLLGTRIWNGTIKRFAYYPKRLSNAELQGITA